MAEKIVEDEKEANKNLLDFHYKLMEILKNGQQIDKDTYKTLGEQFNIPDTATTVHVYIPDDVWYQFPLGVKVKHAGVFTDLDVSLEKINVHIPGSFIIPMKIPGTNLIAGRGNPFTSPVA
ncbi:unnamed protein product [Rotaria magnacalcarata]|uniref:Uncharacterized protein n=1 Tax=Rotaria magnacalcarata TaxID=392030 RepID=A0A8S2VSM0_9BILA|nr:unnamed protein product [Rotaria magnacalcarata]